eukprot:gene25597-11249_t
MNGHTGGSGASLERLVNTMFGRRGAAYLGRVGDVRGVEALAKSTTPEVHRFGPPSMCGCTLPQTAPHGHCVQWRGMKGLVWRDQLKLRMFGGVNSGEEGSEMTKLVPAVAPSSAKKYPRSVRKKDALRLVSKVYSGVTLKQPKEYYDDQVDVEWGSQENFVVQRQLGKGKYGEVYEGVDLRTEQIVVIKIMRPVKEHRLRREIKILRHVSGGPNIIELLEVLRDQDTKTPSFVFEPVDAAAFRELQSKVSDLDVRNYLYQLFKALDHCHSMGIMHRDVKPGNVLIDHAKRQLRLIDWGLADFYHPGKEYPVRVATRFYKGPELLVDIRDYDYSLDVWGAGCMMAALIFKRPVFFRGEDEFDQLVKISKALDLLGQLLKYDHHERLTCKEAMQHPYFAPIRYC